MADAVIKTVSFVSGGFLVLNNVLRGHEFASTANSKASRRRGLQRFSLNHALARNHCRRLPSQGLRSNRGSDRDERRRGPLEDLGGQRGEMEILYTAGYERADSVP